jgi:murein DD-endopeptidase MepM/ murein hydrolase activator NlpD
MIRATVWVANRALVSTLRGAGNNRGSAAWIRIGRGGARLAVLILAGALPLLGGCATSSLTGDAARGLSSEELAGRRIVIESGFAGNKALLLAPIERARVSSPFGPRAHPILGGGGGRIHRGVDFAAPEGTPVRAAGDGTVMAAGPRGGYGHYVRIRHNEIYETAYAHLGGYAGGIHPGRRVRQGEVIGYVGSTGRSTGPHLHYEVLVDGIQVDPFASGTSLVERIKAGAFGVVRAAGKGIGYVGGAVARAASAVLGDDD